MKKYFFLFICVVYAIAQPEKQEDIIKVKTRYGFEVERRPVVNFNIFTDYLKRSENPHLILATEVQNDRLQFIKEGDAYQAEYQISVAIRKDKKALFKETWNETVTLDNFEETNAKQEYQYKVYNLNTTLDEPAPLPPGEYECFFEIRDFTSKNSYNNSREFTIKDYHQTSPLATEIAFLKKDDTNLFNFPLSPAPEGLLFTEPYMAYAKVLADSFPELKFNIRLLKDEGAGYQLFYQKYKTIKSDSGAFKIYFDLPEDSLGEGAYRLRFIGLAGDDEISIDKEFSVHWFEKSTYLYKPDLAA